MYNHKPESFGNLVNILYNVHLKAIVVKYTTKIRYWIEISPTSTRGKRSEWSMGVFHT